jgi:hypothetical protein
LGGLLYKGQARRRSTCGGENWSDGGPPRRLILAARYLVDSEGSKGWQSNSHGQDQAAADWVHGAIEERSRTGG